MFMIVFKPGPKDPHGFEANIHSKGHAPLLFLAAGGGVAPNWADKAEHGTILSYADVQRQLVKIQQLAEMAIAQMTEALQGVDNPPPLVGTVAVVPLVLGAAAHMFFVEPD